MPESNKADFSDSSVKEDIARRVSYWREQANLSRAELARRSGKSRGEITRWECGEVTPAVASINRIATACGVSLAIFLTATLPEEESCQK